MRAQRTSLHREIDAHDTSRGAARAHDERHPDDPTEIAELTSGEAFRLALGPFQAHTLHVLRVRGREALSRLFSWTVTFSTSDPALTVDAVIGQPARLTLSPLTETPREVFGLVRQVGRCAGVEHRRPTFRARIVPQLSRLQRRRTSRVFENRTVPEIVSTVLDLSGVAHRFETRAKYASRGYCVQYDETDLSFVRRLCAESGIWFRFDAPPRPDAERAEEIVTFGDESLAPDMDGGARLLLRPSRGSALRGDDDHVTSFDVRRTLVPGAITLRGHDFRRPEVPLEARATLAAPRAVSSRSIITPHAAGDLTGELAGDVYEHHDSDEDAKDPESGLAVAFLAQLTADARTADGTSVCPRLAPGMRFVLDGETGREAAAHVVTSVVHEGHAARTSGDRPAYENRFTCVPGSFTPRPPRPRRKVRTVTETALVVGPPGSEIHTDEHGRVRVRFHWQREPATADHAACWARVTEPWAGASWGTQWIPRIGMEVLVSFLAGDASRPVVVGCLRNATHPAPFVLPREKAVSGIRTRSTPGGDGYSELSFDDEKGAEVVSLRAERDLVALAQHDVTSVIGHDKTCAVANDRHVKIGRNDALEVGEELTTTVAGTARQEMSDQTIAHSTGGGAGMTLSGGNASLQTKGNISLRAGGDIAIDAAGNITITAGGTVTVRAAGALAITGATLTADAGGAVVIKGGTVDLNP